MIDNLSSKSFLDVPTRSLHVLFNLYSPSEDLWVAVEIFIEFTSLYISPNAINVYVFDNWLFEDSQEKGVRAVGFLRFFLSFYIAVFLIAIKIYKLKNLKKIFSFKQLSKIFVDATIVILMFVNLILENAFFNCSTEKEINKSSFIDIIGNAIIFYNIMIFDAILLLLITIKVISVFTFANSVRIIMKVITKSIINILAYVLILFPILTALSIISYGIYGPHSNNFITFNESYISTLFLLIGQWDIATLLNINPIWTTVYCWLTIFIAIFLVYGSFLSVIFDAYAKTINWTGYPDEQNEKWTAIESIYWILDFIPNRIKRMFSLFKNKNVDIKQPDESEEVDKSEYNSKDSHDNINVN